MCYFSTDNILFSTMSSKDNSKNEGCANNQPCDNSLPGKDTVPRLPTMETATRLRNRMLKTQTEHQATPKSTQPNPGPDFSNPPPNVNQLTQMQDSQQPLTSVSQSKLSATAKEFVPRCQVFYTPDSYSTQECNPDAHSLLSVTAAEFVSQNIAHDSCDSDSSTILDEINNLNLQESYDPDSEYEVPSELAGNLILERFHHALNVLNLNPGNMEEYLRPVCEMIHRSSNTTEIVNVVVESLFEQSIQESNFRYTGARICQFLHSNLKDTSYFSGFREIFLKRCQKEYNRRNELKNGSQAGQERLRGLSMFMAEVLLNVQAVAADGSMQPLTFLPKILLDLAKTLLSTPSDLDVKCSCQLLKLSGSLIDDNVKDSPEKCFEFEEIFTQLKSLQSSSELTENASFLIGSVLKLKDSDWNRGTPSPPKKSIHSFSSDVNNFKVPEPVFYNHMGDPCSRTEAGLPEEEDEDGAYVLNEEEEAAFLEWQAEQDAKTGDQVAWGDNDTGYESYQIEAGADDGGMGDEMEDAYEEFLQKENFLHGYQPPQTVQLPPMTNLSQYQEFSGYQQQPPPHILPANPQQHWSQQHSVDHQQMPANTQSHMLAQQNHVPQQNHLQQRPHLGPPNAQPHMLSQQNQVPPQQLQDQQQQYPSNFHQQDPYHYRR